MARSRQIKPDFFLNESLADVPSYARLLFIGLWLLADREGRLEDRPARIKAQLFPYEDVDVDELLRALDRRFIARYEIEGVPLIEVPKFKKHQHIHPDEKRSLLPKFPGFTGDQPEFDDFSTGNRKSQEIPGDLKRSPEITPCSSSSSSSSSPSSCNSGHAKTDSRVRPPTLEDVKAYCLERKNKVDAQRWFDHYTSNGWKVGRNPMKDWKAAVRTWEKNDYGTGHQNGGAPRGTRIVGGAAPVAGKYDHIG